MGEHSLDGRTRWIAGGSSLVAGALAMFWLVQLLRGHVPGLVSLNVWFLALAALCFGLVGSRREVSERIADAPFRFTLLSLMCAIGAAFKLNNGRTPDLGRAGIVTVAVAIALYVAAYLVRRRWGSPAQAAVAADGASPRVPATVRSRGEAESPKVPRRGAG
jgi:hypothetical protein